MTFRHSGDLGDCIYALAILREIEGTHTLRLVDRPGVTNLLTPRAGVIMPLMEAQPYIEKVECSEAAVDVDFVKFRRFHSHTTTLVQAQLSEYLLNVDGLLKITGEIPWLHAEADKSFAGKVIIARSPRYNNHWFPWRQIVRHYGKRLVFVGTDKEHEDFVSAYGHVNRLILRDFLHLAQVIKGAGIFIGNQSSPQSVAMGLGVRIIQETCLEQPDCIYTRSNVQYVHDGACLLPDVDGSDELDLKSAYLPDYSNAQCSTCPPGNWQYPGLPPCDHYNVILNQIMRKDECTSGEAHVRLLKANVERVPNFFIQQQNDPFQLYKIAYNNAYQTNQ